MEHRTTRRSLRRLGTFALAGAFVVGTAVPARASGDCPNPGTVTEALRDDLAQYLAARGTAEHISADAVTVTFPVFVTRYE